jgi:5-methylcytosine-specific restriction endonuclease McrA
MTSVAAQTLHNRLDKLIDSLAASEARVEDLRRDLGDASLQRHAALSNLLHSIPEPMRKRLQDLVLSGLSRDGILRNQIGALELDLFTTKQELDESVAEFREVWNAQNEEFGEIKARLAAERHRVEERLKEHGISSPEVRAKVWAITDGRCIYCDVELTRERDPNEPHRCFEVDHIVAKANGGPDHISNYVPSCSRCNCSKSDRSVFQFLRQRHAQPDLKVVGGVDA